MPRAMAKASKRSLIALSAQFRIARLDLSSDGDEEKEQQSAVASLEEIYKIKSFENEPLHLLCAIDFAHAQGRLTGSREDTLAAMQSVKRYFSSRGDVNSHNYHAQRLSNAEGDALYRACILYMDAEIAFLQAQKANEQGDKQKTRSMVKAAKTIFKSLIEKNFLIPKYLSDEAEFALESLDPGTGDFLKREPIAPAESQSTKHRF